RRQLQRQDGPASYRRLEKRARAQANDRGAVIQGIEVIGFRLTGDRRPTVKRNIGLVERHAIPFTHTFWMRTYQNPGGAPQRVVARSNRPHPLFDEVRLERIRDRTHRGAYVENERTRRIEGNTRAELIARARRLIREALVIALRPGDDDRMRR